MTTERLRRAGQVAWAIVGVTTLVAILGLVVWTFRVVLPPLILAGAIVFILNPFVTILQRRGIPRAAGAGIAYLIVIGAITLAGVLMAPFASDQIEQLLADWPDIRDKTERWIDARAVDSENWVVQLPSVDELRNELGNEGDSLSEQLRRAREIGLQVFHVLLIVVLAPIIAFYLLVDVPHLRTSAEALIPRGARDEVLLVGHRLNRAIGGFFRGQLLVAFIVGVMCSIGLALIGLEFWFLIGMIAGLFNVIPLVGPWIGGIPGVVIALTTGSPLQALGVVAIMAGAQQIDNHFITPQVMQRAVRLHPAAVMLALLAGGTLGGFFGLLLAVPVAAVVKIIVGHVWRVHVLGEPLEEVARAHGVQDAAPGTGMVEDVVDITPPPGDPTAGSEAAAAMATPADQREPAVAPSTPATPTAGSPGPATEEAAGRS